MLHDFMNKPFVRMKAVAIHLGISVFIFLLLLFLIFFQWYPQPFFSTDGGLHGARIAFFVNVVLGPMLTAIIFKPKKSLKKIQFDLTCIGIVQITALCVGVYLIRDQRPVAIIHYDSAFYSITTQQLEPQNTPVSDLKRFGLESPVWLHNEGPLVQSEFATMMTKSINGIEEFRQTERFRSLKHHMNQVTDGRLDITKVAQRNPKTQKALDKLLNAYPDEPPIFHYFYGRYGTSILAFNPQGQMIGYLPAPAS